jgi:hypothetical protein
LVNPKGKFKYVSTLITTIIWMKTTCFTISELLYSSFQKQHIYSIICNAIVIKFRTLNLRIRSPCMNS